MKKNNYTAPSRIIHLGDIPMDVAMLPDGDYCLSQTQVAEIIGETPESIIQFLNSDYFKANWNKGCKLFNLAEVYLEGVDQPIKPVSIGVASLYWNKCAAAGNKKAQRLTLTLMQDGLRGIDTFNFDTIYSC